MRWKSISALLLAILLSAGAASYQFGDSAHAIGLINKKGGKARHGFLLKPGQDRYTLIATATVLPPVHGDIRVTLQGKPAMDYAIYDSRPPIDLNIHRRPLFSENVLLGVEPRDRLALWVVMRPGDAGEGAAGWLSAPTPLSGNSGIHDEPLALVFTDQANQQEVLRIPVIFTGREGAQHGE